MKIKILQNKIREGLSVSGRVTSKSVSLPILKNIYMETVDNFLSLSSTDLEVGVKWWSLAKVSKEGKTTVPYDVFSSFINLLPEDEKVEMEVDNDNISVNCGDYKTKIKGLSAEDFPIIPEVKDGKEVELKTESFLSGLRQVVGVPSNTKVKPEISGVYFSFKGNSLKLAATDSYRLAEKTIFMDEKVKDEFSFILPQKSAKEVLNIFDSEEVIEIKFDSNQVLFQAKMDEMDHPKVQLVSKLIEGDYPDYKAIIPEKTTTDVLIQRDEFLNKIKAASLFSGKVNEITLKIDTGSEKIKILSEDSDLGNYETEMSAKTNGDNVDISFNHRFLTEGLKEIKSSEVVLYLDGESDPGKIVPVGNDEFLYVVMPIKTS